MFTGMALRCLVNGCVFYANDGCFGTCSEHSIYKPVKILSFLRPRLPRDILDIIWEFSKNNKAVPISDDEIITRLGIDAEQILVGRELIEERLLWLQHHDLPYLHCDNIQAGLDALQLPQNKKLRREDAIRLMTVIDQRNPSHFTRLAMEKAVVIKTLHRAALPADVFPIGLCYHGGKVLTNQTPIGVLRQSTH